MTTTTRPRRRSGRCSRKRAQRRRTIATRDGMHCAYCGDPFADLAAATLDHIAPYRLMRTWASAHLVLACRTCNDRKADRLPLLLALLLLTVHGAPEARPDGFETVRTVPEAGPDAPEAVHGEPEADATAPETAHAVLEAVHGGRGRLSGSADREHDAAGVHAAYASVFTPAALAMLAAVAHAHESGRWPLESAHPTPDRTRDQSMPDLHDEARHTRVAPDPQAAVNAAVNAREHPDSSVFTATPHDPSRPDSTTRLATLREAA